MKQQFTNAGFQALLSELYLLPNILLEEEAKQILLDFKIWVSDHFELTKGQLNFMNLLDPRMIYFMAAQTSVAVANRLEINLIKDEENEHLERDEKKKKIICSKVADAASSDSMENYKVGGSLNIIIAYEPLN